MGCNNSKSKNKATLNRLSQYHLAAMEETEGLVRSPVPLDDDLDAQTEVLPVKTLHNIFYDGFYAPYVRNPDYLLLVDMRADEAHYRLDHILTARWHGHVDGLRAAPGAEKDPLRRFWHIILYDSDGSSVSRPDSDMRRLCRQLRERKLEPCCLEGGLRAIRDRCPYLLSRRSAPPDTTEEGFRLLSWFPSIILDGRLFLGRNDQAADPEVLDNLGVSHVICTNQALKKSRRKESAPPDKRVLMLAPPSELEAKFKRKSRGTSCLSRGSTDTLDDPAVTSNLLTDKMAELTAFVREAFAAGGKVLVHGEQGVDRSAALVMALLMQQCSCSLEDAFYHVKACRPTVQPSEMMLQALAKLEAEIFGKRLTSIEDLCY